MKNAVKTNLPGSIASAGNLLTILEAAEQAGVEHVPIGTRQQLLFEVATEQRRGLLQALAKPVFSAKSMPTSTPNSSSSYVVEDVFHPTTWLREGVYKDLLDLFDFQPQLKINLIDRHQTFAAFFTVNPNFVISDTPNYWYFYLRFPKVNALYCWPGLVYSEDIPGLSHTVEQAIFANQGYVLRPAGRR